MPHVQYWARVRADQDCPLRRGAWYRVVELTPVEAIVDVNHRLLHIPRAFVQVLPLRPPAWTVVPGPEGAAAGAGRKYGVCPLLRAGAPGWARPRDALPTLRHAGRRRVVGRGLARLRGAHRPARAGYAGEGPRPSVESARCGVRFASLGGFVTAAGDAAVWPAEPACSAAARVAGAAHRRYAPGTGAAPPGSGPAAPASGSPAFRDPRPD